MIPRHSEGVFHVYSTSNSTARGTFSLQCLTVHGTAAENAWKKYDSDFLRTQQRVLLRVIMWLQVKQIIPPRSRGYPLPSFSRSALRGPRFVEVWWLALGVQSVRRHISVIAGILGLFSRTSLPPRGLPIKTLPMKWRDEASYGARPNRRLNI